MGLPGTGKTTLAKKIIYKLKKSNYSTLFLDGDMIRQSLSNYKYDHKSRVNLSKIYIKFAKKLLNQFDYIVLSSIMLYKEMENILIKDKNIYPFIIINKFSLNKNKKDIRKKYLNDIPNFYMSNVITIINNQEVSKSVNMIVKKINLKLIS